MTEGDRFSILVSMEGPKGTDLSKFLRNAEKLKGRIDGAYVSDGPDAIMRISPLAPCIELAKIGIRPILGVTGRDRNRLALQGDLLSAWTLGIRDVVVEDGKDPSFGDHPLTKPIQDVPRSAMVEMLAALNSGTDMAGQTLSGAPDFSFGAHVEWLDNPGQIDNEFERMAAMTQAGASLFITSPQFDSEHTVELCKRAAAFNAKVYVGVLLLKSVGMARYLNEVPGVSQVPDEVIEKMNQAAVKAKAGIQVAAEFIQAIEKVAAGAVIIPMGWEKKIPDVLEAIGR
jgi:methylenetetrahydrofolate reductase (NADH)